MFGLGVPNLWSPAGGQIRSSYGPAKLDPSASSGGSAVGVAARFCSASIGVETGGSILSFGKWQTLRLIIGLSSENGGFIRAEANSGFRPDQRHNHHFVRRTTSRDVDADSVLRHRCDSAGPLGKSAWDIAALLEAMVRKKVCYTFSWMSRSTTSNVTNWAEYDVRP